jgi:hypothetical protein
VPALFKPSRIALLSLLAVLAVLLAFWFARPDPLLASALRLQQRVASEETRRLPPAEQFALQLQLRAELQKLSPSGRQVVTAARRRLLIDRIQRYRALPREEQLAYLDDEINRLTSLQREEANAAGGDQATTGRRSGQRQNTSARWTVPEIGDSRESYLKAQLDKTSPADRAMVADFIKQLIDRWKGYGLIRADVSDDPKTILAAIMQ